MIGRREIQQLARAGGVDERTQERDYVLTWLLTGMAVQDMGLVFTWDDRLRDPVVEVPAFDGTWRRLRRVLRQAGYQEASPA